MDERKAKLGGQKRSWLDCNCAVSQNNESSSRGAAVQLKNGQKCGLTGCGLRKFQGAGARTSGKEWALQTAGVVTLLGNVIVKGTKGNENDRW